MKTKKKLISMLLVACMALSMMSVVAFADAEETQPMAEETQPMETAVEPPQVSVDNSVDESKAIVVGVLSATDKSKGVTHTDEVYNETVTVTYTDARTPEVEEKITAAKQALQESATSKGYTVVGEATVDASTPSAEDGTIWDNRQYEDTEDDGNITATGGYGKKTTYTVTLNAEFESISAENMIKTAEVTAQLSYNAGDKPKASATVPSDSKYAVALEHWVELGANNDRVARKTIQGTVASSFSTYFADVPEKDITFEEGKTYQYFVQLIPEDVEATAFANDCTATVNGTAADASRLMSDLFIEGPTMTIGKTDDKYEITEGANSTWIKNSTNTLTFSANGALDKFAGIKVDGNEVTSDKYTATSGSTVITLKSEYLATLAEGKHTIVIEFNDGECSAEFEVKAGNMISSVVLNDVVLSYKAGETPKATASVPADANYGISGEAWYELDQNLSVTDSVTDHIVNGQILTSDKYLAPSDPAYLYSYGKYTSWGHSATDAMKFEEGKTYLYVILLSPKGDNDVWDGTCSLSINGTKYEFNSSVYGGTNADRLIKITTMTPKSGDQTKPTYEITEGANATWTQGSDTTLSFKTNGDFSKFAGVKIDGYVIPASKYTTASGSNVITISKEYLTTLTTGSHTLVIMYSDGECSTLFEITAPVTPTPVTYKFTEGANSTWVQNSTGTLTFRVDGDFTKFTGIKVDGNIVSADKYTAVSGSTVITLKSEYLATLSAGNHTLNVLYTDGAVGTTFTISATGVGGVGAGTTTDPNAAPKTGDTNNLALLLVLSLISIGGIAGATIAIKKKHTN